MFPQAPRAGSYSPPGTGCNNVSKVAGFCIFLTERLLISAGDRNPKSTLPMAEGTGCEMFMADHRALQGTAAAVLLAQESVMKTLRGTSFESNNARELFLVSSRAVTQNGTAEF
jgi:hypothetical protein